MTAQKLWGEWEAKIARHEDTAVCLQGLDSQQRKQLAALLIETLEAFEYRQQQGARSRLRRHLAGEAEPRTRMLDRKLEKARKAVQELEDYASDAGTGPSDQSCHAARQMLGRKYHLAARRALRELRVQTTPDEIEFCESQRNEYATPDHAEGFGMVQLYWFFRHECRLTGNESEVRVARLRNAFWTDHGVSDVKYRRTYQDAESIGCEAVHGAIHRWRR